MPTPDTTIPSRLSMQSMSLLKRINDAFALVLTLVAALCLATLTVLVFYGVVMRYVFNNAPDFVEPIALLMVVAIAMFGAALKVREGGHIGLDSFVERLPAGGKRAAHVLQKLCLIAFAVVIFIGCFDMAETTFGDRIPILGLPEAVRYWIPIVASVAIALFALERLIGLFAQDAR